MTEDPTIARLWHGWTDPADADAYERLLTRDLVPEFVDRVGAGYEGFELLRREHDEETEFVTVFRFGSWEAVERFAGEDYESAHVPAPAEDLLIRYEDRAAHFEVRDRRE